ncbi:MAG: sulfatase [Verrucomicrobiales bacterium]|nr:sulfatase [Verrucomicrobiales bacterium]
MTLRLLAAVLLAFVTGFLEAKPPNFLIIVADDCTYNDLPVYGGENAKTPNIDALAARGLVFNKAYLAEAMCQPCRAELYTGQYPIRNGCAWNHSASRPTTKSLPHFLEPAGYRVGLAGKVHVKPEAAFPFETVPGFDKSCVRDVTQTHDLGPAIDFMSREEEQDPFCLVIALVEPHIPWTMGDASQYPPKKIKLPPNIADTPVTRQHFADYLAEITYMDSQVGDILDALKKSGCADNTLVLFTSEQGSQFPGCKWTNWDTGIHTALIAAWPGQIEGGKRTDALVQYADFAPTLLDLAGKKDTAPEGHVFDGTSFAGVLRGETDTHRKFAYGIHNNLPEGPPYPIRTVTDGTYRYIRNLRPDDLYIEKHLMGGGRLNNPYWATWVGADPLKNPGAYDLVKRYMRRPAEQLYLTSSDPYEMENLAGTAEHTGALEKLRTELDSWMTEQKDPGAAVDTEEALKNSRKGTHEFGPATAKN